MAAKGLRAATALAVSAGLLLVPASAGARTQAHAGHANGHASASDVCHSITLPGVPAPFNVVTICVPVPSVG
jgi:hypothetical protein